MAGWLEAVSCDIVHVLDDGGDLVADIVEEDLTAFVDLFDLVVS